MTFLNSALLAALSLGLLPILIHLLNRQKFKNIDFPTLRFLRELQRQKMRQVKIRQWLLLALRTLAVIFLVLALTRPVLKSDAGILPGVEARTTAILVLDRSASMQTETPDGPRFRRLQTRAQEILSLLGDNDDCQIVWADAVPDVYPENLTNQIRTLREAISDARPGESGGNLVAALQKARQIAGTSLNLHKEIYIVSDFSRSAWPEAMPESAILPQDVRVFLINAGATSSAVTNVGVTSAQIVSRIITPGRPVELEFRALNSGPSALEDRIASVYLGGKRVAQVRFSVDGGQEKTQRVRFVPPEAGDQTGYVALEDADDFSADNKRYYVLRVPTKLNVAVAGSPGAARDLVSLAMNPTRDPDGFVQAAPMTPFELEGEDWTKLDAIFVVDAGAMSSAFASRLHSFCESGKGVFVLFGPQSDLKSYSSWLPALGLPNPGELWEAQNSTTKWSQVDLAHPLFEGLFAEKPQDVSVEVRKLLKTAATSTAVPVISTTAGPVFMWESKIGKGHALMITSSPDPTWSSLFRGGIFPPLMVSGAAYLAGIATSGAANSLECGVASVLHFSGAPGDQGFELRGDPDRVTPLVETIGAGYDVKIPALAHAQEAALWQGNRPAAAIVINVPGAESAVQSLDEKSYESIVGGKISRLDSDADTKKAVMEGRFGRELWKLCLMVALALLVAEMLVGRVGKSQAVPQT